MELLKWLILLCASVGLCQKDCTGVDCPVLKNCIDEVLENGACCSTCVQTGCACEGYQYYDCVNAGFQKGKVPEGESYFVDFGSTECSCPKGGGRISCHFIPCPELPANCIDISEPADGCIQCERIGCVHNRQKYEAGHSFHMDPCQVCHCPNDGGNLMCYPIPDCDPGKVHKPILTTTTEENPAWRRQNDPIRHIFNHPASRRPFTKPFPLSHTDALPPFKSPHGSHQHEEEEQEEEDEDYDYPTPDSPEQSFPNSPTQSSISHPEKVMPHKGPKQELKEKFAVHEATTDKPWFPLFKKTDKDKDNPRKETLKISDATRGKISIPEDKRKLPIFRETTYEEQFSIDRDVSERQSFGLYKENFDKEALEESNTDSERLPEPTETTGIETLDSTDRDTLERKRFGIYKENVDKEEFEESNTDSEGPPAPTGTSNSETIDSIDQETSEKQRFGLYKDTKGLPAPTETIGDETFDQTDQETSETQRFGLYKNNFDKETLEESNTDSEGLITPTETTDVETFYSIDQETSKRRRFGLYKENFDEKTLEEGNTENEGLITPTETTDVETFDSIDQETSERRRFGLYKDNEGLPAPTETTNGKILESTDRDTLERQRFGLYKDNFDEEAFEESNTDSEGLPASTETTDVDTFGTYEDTTYSDAVTESPATVAQTTPHMETTKTWHTTRSQISRVHNRPLTTEVLEVENYSIKEKEDETKVDQKEGIHESKEKESVSQSSTKPPEDFRTKPEIFTLPPVGFIPTSQTRVNPEEEDPPKRLLEREEQENLLSSSPKSHHEGESDADQLKICCDSGHKWASENLQCDQLPAVPHHNSVCGVLQEQCCVGTLRESRCLAGITAARAGEVCEDSDGPLCGEDTQKECCSCCALGLRMRREGKSCDVHQHLNYPCGHAFLTCCEEGAGPDEGAGLNTPELRRRERPRPTALPKRVVSDRQVYKHSFSVDEAEQEVNSVEKLEDVGVCERFDGQLCTHTCVNTPGSYRCVCRAGHTLQQDGHTCTPENPEDDNRVKEEDRAFTPATPARKTTPLHNPCAGNTQCSQQCSVVRGKARCSCFPGFSLKSDGHTCEDLNECVTHTHTCLPDERCVNTLGAFVCERQISCPAGYQLRNGVCEDVDECVLRTHNCGSGYQCQNTLGSFHCSSKQQPCLTGFIPDTHGNCIDVDECVVVSEACTLGFTCINTVGSYTCQRKVITCSRGFHSSPDGARCVDVDECVMGTHTCGDGQVCQNTPGSFRCDCQTGYQYDSIHRTCTDINECWRFPGRLCAQSCDNSPGSYQCSCTTGFSLAFDGKNCEDVNECENSPCSQECANVYGSYQCYCRLGFYLKEDGHTCEDIDECSQSIGNLCVFQCVNIAGSYQCACPPQGYTMSPNGHTCTDIDECATGVHNCSDSQTCYNLQGGFRCLSFTCPENYRKVSDTRCERLSCPGFQDCQDLPLRITYYTLSFQTNILVPAQIFRIGPSPAYSGDNVLIRIPRGNQENFFSSRRLNSFTGAVYLQRQISSPRDFLIDVEMKLLRQGTVTTFLARIHVFITSHNT